MNNIRLLVRLLVSHVQQASPVQLKTALHKLVQLDNMLCKEMESARCVMQVTNVLLRKIVLPVTAPLMNNTQLQVRQPV